MARIKTRELGGNRTLVPETGFDGHLLPSRQLARSTTFDPRDETIFFAILSATVPIVCFRSSSLAGLPVHTGI